MDWMKASKGKLNPQVLLVSGSVGAGADPVVDGIALYSAA